MKNNTIQIHNKNLRREKTMERKTPVKKHKRFDPRLNRNVNVSSYNRREKVSQKPYRNIHNGNKSISVHQEKISEIIRSMNSLRGLKWTAKQQIHLNKAYNEIYAILNEDYEIYEVE